jgi:hypothetical protein
MLAANESPRLACVRAHENTILSFFRKRAEDKLHTPVTIERVRDYYHPPIAAPTGSGPVIR